jgi:hypothetical protein
MPKYLLLAALLLTVGCTQNQRAKSFGGSMVVDLPPGQALKFATWKETSLWYATEPRKAGVAPVEVVMREDSDLGIVQGAVTFREH